MACRVCRRYFRLWLRVNIGRKSIVGYFLIKTKAANIRRVDVVAATKQHDSAVTCYFMVSADRAVSIDSSKLEMLFSVRLYPSEINTAKSVRPE
jgi:hypothetical protein